MMRRQHAVLVALFSIAALSVGCTDNPVGRICDLGGTAAVANTVVVASPSLDCVSRTCLLVPAQRTPPPGSGIVPDNSGLCTAECSADSDCDRVPESPCVSGFTCGVATTAGPFCCRKLCICKDYIVLPASGELDVPKTCLADDPKNECCNLSGRDNNPAYPNCKS